MHDVRNYVYSLSESILNIRNEGNDNKYNGEQESSHIETDIDRSDGGDKHLKDSITEKEFKKFMSNECSTKYSMFSQYSKDSYNQNLKYDKKNKN